MSKEEKDYSVYDSNGRFNLEGIVFVGGEHYRMGQVFVKSVGYELYDELEERFNYVSQEEALELVEDHGIQNAYVRRGHLQLYNGEEEVKESVLNIPVMELAEDGEVRKPSNVVLDRDRCSDRMEEVIDRYLERIGVSEW